MDPERCERLQFLEEARADLDGLGRCLAALEDQAGTGTPAAADVAVARRRFDGLSSLIDQMWAQRFSPSGWRETRHDIKNSLGVIRNFAELLEAEWALPGAAAVTQAVSSLVDTLDSMPIPSALAAYGTPRSAPMARADQIQWITDAKDSLDLADLCARLELTEAEEVTRLMEGFLESTKEGLGPLEHAVVAREVSLLRSQAHYAKGAALNASARRLATLFAGLETFHPDQADWVTAEALMAAVRGEMARVGDLWTAWQPTLSTEDGSCIFVPYREAP